MQHSPGSARNSRAENCPQTLADVTDSITSGQSFAMVADRMATKYRRCVVFGVGHGRCKTA